MTGWRTFIALLALAMPSWQSASAQAGGRPVTEAQVQGPRSTPAAERGRTIPGRFVITLRPRVDPRTVAGEHGLEPDFVYTRVITGFAGSMSEVARSGLLRDHRVVRVEPDRPARAKQVQSWGLDRIDQRALPLDGQFQVPGSGRGVSVYVVDTGIRFDHSQFEGRAVRGYDAIGDGLNGSDCDGHGTHVAGTVGGRTVGVAREATLVSVRVLDCEGTGMMSGVIAGLDWIAKNGRRPGVVNMSLGGDPHTTTDDAVKGLVELGFPAIIAAGNESRDACQTSPARVAEAITVAASNDSDSRPSWSNYGSCVDIFAPGESIVSAWHTGTNAGASASGTSMAAPHVAGAAALLLEANSGATPSAIGSTISNDSTKGVISDAASANNHLLFISSGSGAAAGGVTITGTSGNDIVNRTRTVSGQPLPTDEADMIHGLAGADSLSSEGGNDSIYGGDGNDRLDGGPGDDTLDGGNGIDTATYAGAPAGVTVNLSMSTAQNTGGAGADALASIENLIGSSYNDRLTGDSGSNTFTGGLGADSLSGGDGRDRLIGGDANDVLYGQGDNDRLEGGNGNDMIIGGPGNDTLIGDAGGDRFRFNTALHGSTNVDTIADFSVGEDAIQLSRSIFTALETTGTLPASAFRTGTAAADADDRIIYNSGTGEIFHDPDGTGPAAQVRFARVKAGVALTNSSFVAIP